MESSLKSVFSNQFICVFQLFSIHPSLSIMTVCRKKMVILLYKFSTGNNSSVRQSQLRASTQARFMNGDAKSKRKGTKHKSKAAVDDLVLSSSSDNDLSLTTLDVSSPSDSDLTPLKLDRSHRGKID